MIKEILSQLRAFRWQKLLIIWAVFVAMAAILFAERSGIQYEAAKFKLNYLPLDRGRACTDRHVRPARHLPAALRFRSG